MGDQSEWVFDSTPLVRGTQAQLSQNEDLIFYLHIQYTPLVRDVVLDMDITVDDGFRQYTKYDVDRKIMLAKGSRDHNVICKLFYPGQGTFNFRFHFRDDVWGTDPPLVFPLSISMLQNN